MDTSSPERDDGEVWLVYRWARSSPPYDGLIRARRLDDSVCPTVTAAGLGSAYHSRFYLCGRDGVPAEAIVTASETVAEAHRPRRRGSRQIPGQLSHQLDKPPYKRPTLKAIRRRRRNGLKVVSTFCSAGGSTTGYLAAGYEVCAAVEFIPAAAESYRANHPRTTLLERDIREVSAADLMKAAGVKEGELDVLDGSPPCEPFSMAGKREATWGKENNYSGTVQRSDDLFFEFARLVKGMRPRAFVAENVKGLVTGAAKGYFNEILAELKACGYRVSARVLDAQWLGVPQHRERVIFVGIRDDLGAEPPFPTPLPYRYSVRDALPHIGRHGTDPNFDRRRRERLTTEQMMADSSSRPHPTVTGVPGSVAGSSGSTGVIEEDQGPPRRVEERLVHRVDHGDFAEQGDVTDRPAPTIQARRQQGASEPVELGVEERVLYDDGRTPETSGVRPRPVDITDEPAPTVTTGGSAEHHNIGTNASHWSVEEEEAWDEQIVGNEAFEPKFGSTDGPHPTVMASGARTSGELRSSTTKRRRRLTIDELKAICGFPPDYVLTGSFAQQWERLGDAVPPPMMERIAKALEPLLLEARK